MNAAWYMGMKRLLDRYSGDDACVLDVGSYNVNGSFRSLVEGRGWQYTGLDIVPGPNVDVVSTDRYRYPFDDGAFDIVLSGSTMEHVEAIWRWVPELARLVRPGGLLAIMVPCQWGLHRYPVDCWRVLPDGLRFLFDECGNLERYDVRCITEQITAGIAWKVAA